MDTKPIRIKATTYVRLQSFGKAGESIDTALQRALLKAEQCGYVLRVLEDMKVTGLNTVKINETLEMLQ